MIYIRKLFTQDLRDGKQIAFPKEPSLFFFFFDYLNNEADRKISFKFDSVGKEFAEFNGTKIETRLYAAGSESRIDGELKAFLRDKLKIGINDFLIIKNNPKNNAEYDFFVVTTNNRTIYDNYLSLTNEKNHTLVITSEEKIPDKNKERRYNRIIFGAPGTGKSRSLSDDAQEFEKDNVIRFKPEKRKEKFLQKLEKDGKEKYVQYLNEHLDFSDDLFSHNNHEEIKRIFEVKKKMILKMKIIGL